ncbi:MAG TPA: FlgD immunoglobulin-like domain containing protein [Candidatus Krumholzibacteria bacterium]|nr:FlgD immunoglobulin-like domain containing protein [Candidatus Krumholzibacteria bacterium]
MRMIRGRVRHLMFTCLLVATWTNAHALVRYSFEHSLYTEPPEPILDHCVVEQDGLYHLFYLRGNPAVNIGHATTTDFKNWEVRPPVLTTGTWDNKAMWAPQLFRPAETSSWSMFYTGVNTVSSQQTGIAFSNDLNAWFKYPDPIYHPDIAWAEWSVDNFSHGRDPHIVEDGGKYYMFVTAKTNDNRGAVACAVSDNLFQWTDIGPIFVNTSWHVLESVFIFKHAGKWQMFFTEETVGGTTAMVSDSLLSGWDSATKRVIDGGHAPQVTNTIFGEMFSRHAVHNDGHGNYQYVIRFTPLVWLGQIPAIPKPLPLSGQWTFVSGDAFYYQPTWGNNAATRNDNYAKTFVGDGWINTYEYYTGPLGYGGPGSVQGDSRVGVIRSPMFTVTGNSMSALVGGGDFPGECYLALVDSVSGAPLFSETGRNSNEMTRRNWDLRPHLGKRVYLEVADLSTASFGHICVDDIIESYEVYNGGSFVGGRDGGTGRSHKLPDASLSSGAPPARDNGIAHVTRLGVNTPNPFNPVTHIDYELAQTAAVRIDVFDARGARVRTLLNETRPAGAHRVTWPGTRESGATAPSGVYFYRLTVNGAVVDTRKMVLLK